MLDKKTPLLRSMERISTEAVKLLHLLGRTDVTRVITTVGPEQEYFLIDRALYDKREDLKLTGRTLFGAKAPKGQELDDHYFGAIKTRVAAYMKELDEELWKLGVLAKTKHNEVAPSQHELAPIFTTSNIANDHNELTMEIMQKIAEKHGLVCLLHEKPFAGVNGSGKHNNWSLSTNTGENLLSPGKHPEDNLTFQLFLSAVIKAVDEYQDLLRATVASAGNDHRLGAHEAPPAIMSVYLGDDLGEMVESIINGEEYVSHGKEKMLTGVDVLADFKKDTSDRNRTSPFAFTGNKFEFRAPGSTICCSGPMTVLNTIVAEAVDRIAGELEKAKVAGKAKPGEHTPAFHNALQKILQASLKAHKRVVFNGNGYEAEWPEEAARRGLPNAPDTPSALAALAKKENIALFAKYGVMTGRELESRHEIFLEEYEKKIRIEGACARDIASEMVFPAVKAEYLETADAFARAEKVGVSSGTTALREVMVELGAGLDALRLEIHDIEEALGGSDVGVIIAAMRALRTTVDAMEKRVDGKRWPLPKYRDMLFLY